MGKAATWESWKTDPGRAGQAVAMLTDTSDCIGCKACEVACKQWNGNEARILQESGTYQSHPSLDARTWTVVRFTERTGSGGQPVWLMHKHNCMHCTEAACVTVCPTDALKYGSYGAITLERDACIGCGYCEEACPFGAAFVDKRAWNTTAQKAGKCTLCYDRIAAGMQPACAKTCPTDCIKYGDRAELIKWGRQRVEALRARGFGEANLYGESELGGLHQLLVLVDKPAAYGLPVAPQISRRLTFWKYGLQPVGKALFGAAILGLAVNWFVARRTWNKRRGHEGDAAD